MTDDVVSEDIQVQLLVVRAMLCCLMSIAKADDVDRLIKLLQSEDFCEHLRPPLEMKVKAALAGETRNLRRAADE